MHRLQGLHAACPYDAIFINPEDLSAEKCNLCAHRLDVGLEPACVTVCPTEAILVGDINDPAFEVSRVVSREPVQVRRPEKEARPGVYSKGAHTATLDPLAARRPGGGLFAWATHGKPGPQSVTSGHPGRGTSQAAALGKRRHALGGTGAGAGLPRRDRRAARRRPEAPGPVYLLFTRHHWRNWLVRGAVILGGFGTVAAVYLLTALAGTRAGWQVLGCAGLPLALAAAVCTAYLFTQARAATCGRARCSRRT